MVNLFLLIWLLLSLPVVVQAQFDYAASNNAVIITKYYGGQPPWYSDATIPDTIDGMSVTGIGDYAFFNCVTMLSVSIPDSVTSIGNYAFGNCYSLSDISIPTNVTTMGYGAFYECAFFDVSIPKSVTNMDNAFYNCINLISITVDSSNPAYSSLDGVLFNKNQTKLLKCPRKDTGYTVPNGVTCIGNYAFDMCATLPSVTIPNSVTNIGDGAFYQGFNLTSYLTSVFFRGNSPSLGTSVFGGVPATIYYLPGTAGWGATFGGLPTVLWNPQLQLTGGVVQITGNTNIPVVVEACTNLASPVWTPLQNTTLTGGTLSITDAPPNAGSRFYRVRSP